MRAIVLRFPHWHEASTHRVNQGTRLKLRFLRVATRVYFFYLKILNTNKDGKGFGSIIAATNHVFVQVVLNRQTCFMKQTILKIRDKLPMNIHAKESLLRILLIIPVGILTVYAISYFKLYFLIAVPIYLFLTGLLRYSPVKHVYSLIKHKPASDNPLPTMNNEQAD